MIKIKLKPNQSLNKNVWKSYKSKNISQKSNRALSKTTGLILRKTLNNDQIVEYDLIKELSKKLIIDNYMRLFYHAIKNVSMKIQSSIQVYFNL
jgi:hypothetical protein